MTWFDQRRYGLFVHLTVATVPAFAPRGEYAEWYWSHLSPTPLADVVLHPAPMPEVIAWHEEHYGAGFAYDDFIPQLTLDHWDAGAVAALARDAGMGYVVPVTKHHDGYCWWDSALTDRTSVKSGPRRDVIADLHAAARAAGLVFGAYHSLLDWSHPAYPDPHAYVAGFLHRQIGELVERFAPEVLWADGQWGHQPGHWRSEQLVDAYRKAMAGAGLEALVNDRWGVAEPDFATFEYDVPAAAPDGRWELCRGVGASFGHNRVETPGDHLDARGIVALLTEVVAKGGNLLLSVGPAADGTIPAAQSTPLVTAGAWVRANADAIDGSARFDTWGDADVRFTVTPGADGDGADRINVFDVGTGAGRVLTGIDLAAWQVERVTDRAGAPVEWGAGSGRLAVGRPRWLTDDLATTYHVHARRRSPIAVAPPPPTAGAICIGSDRFASIAAALAAALPGQEVVLGPGVYGPGELFPVVVPGGVVLRGDGHPASVVIDATGRGAGQAAVLLDDAAAGIVGVTVRGAPQPVYFLPPVAVFAEDADGLTVQGCYFEGSVVLERCATATITGNRVTGGAIVVRDCDRAEVTANRQAGVRWGVGLAVSGGEGVTVEDNEATDDLCAIRVRRARDARLRGNRVAARWWGVHVVSSTGTIVASTRIVRTMRALTVTGGERTRLEGNAVDGCDTGMLLEGGAAAVDVIGNTIEGCRVGIFLWDAAVAEAGDNVVKGSTERDLYQRPAAPVAPDAPTGPPPTP